MGKGLSMVTDFARKGSWIFGIAACCTATSANADYRLSRREEVIASVECKVRDAGDLQSFLGINKDSIIKIETLSSYESTISVDGEPYFTGFPAVLNFSRGNKQFSLSGEDQNDEGSRVSLQIQGPLNSKNDGVFIFGLTDSRVDAMGTGKLNHCRRTL